MSVESFRTSYVTRRYASRRARKASTAVWARRFALGSALVMNTYLCTALAMVSLLALGLLVPNFRRQGTNLREALAAGRADRRDRPCQGRPVRGVGLSVASGRAAAFPHAVRGPKTSGGSRRPSSANTRSRFLFRRCAGGRHDRPERPDPGLRAAYYLLARWTFLRETGRKLTHLDVMASEGAHEDLPPELWSTRG